MTLRYLRTSPGAIIGTAAEFTARNLILLARQVGIETDTGSSKLGNGVTHWNDLSYLPGGGSDQIAAKSTGATPAGGPGLYALTSDAVEDGGWVQVAIEDETVDLKLSRTSDQSNIDLQIVDFGGGPDVTTILTAAKDETSAEARMEATSDGEVAASLVWVTGGDAAARLLYNTVDGAYLQIEPKAGQTHRLLVVNSDQFDSGEFPAPIPAFAVDIQGAILFSPDGTGYRLKVANDGVLSTEAV